MHFTRQLAVFVKAGIPITEALDIIGDETEDVALRRTISAMVEDLRNGGTLSDAASKHPEAFPIYYMGILQSAELTGKLDETLESLAGYLEREVETRSKVVVGAVVPERRHGDGACSPSASSPATCCPSSSRCSRSSTPTCRCRPACCCSSPTLFTVL